MASNRDSQGCDLDGILFKKDKDKIGIPIEEGKISVLPIRDLKDFRR
jgi:hypothetical protein